MSAPTPALTSAPADRLEPNGVALAQAPAEPFRLGSFALPGLAGRSLPLTAAGAL